MPYLWGAAVEAHRDGVPTMRAMLMEFPDDPACDTLDRQYLLGGALLVAPVFTEDGTVDYYLPAGRWTHLLDGKVQEGGRWHRATHDFLSLPLFVRPGTVLPLGATEDRPDYNHAENVTFRLYELADGVTAACDLPALNGSPGLRCSAKRSGRQVEVTLDGTVPAVWRVQLAGVAAPNVPAGATLANDALGAIVTPGPGARTLCLGLPANQGTSSN
jgi:alpha-D-xyloside xylohydrolase